MAKNEQLNNEEWRNATGKIEKPKLREKYCGKSLVQIQIEK